ncbi:D-apiose isomerase [subsurface metagenome]|nr:TIM barrel protein [Clostridia bacterium]
MSKEAKFSTVLSSFGNPVDRFCKSGYKSDKTLEELFIDASKVEDLTGLELVGTWDVNEESVGIIKKFKNEYGFEIVNIVVDLFTKFWQKGSFSSTDPNIRARAIEEVKKCMDIASELDCNMVGIWPGQDGYDYIFQQDYMKAWKFLVEGIKECAEYRKDIKIGIEYKQKEPRTHCFVGTIGKTMTLQNAVNKNNVGLIIDVGHALAADENAAESIAFCKQFNGRLFHLHLNDNYRHWDDDMMIGSVHILEYLELIYWLKRIDYDGWYALDIFPYREDGIGATSESIKWLKAIIRSVDALENSGVKKIIEQGDVVKTSSFLREFVLK